MCFTVAYAGVMKAPEATTMTSRETKTISLSNALAAQISSGRYSPGERIPSFRELANRYDVSLLTASAAVNNLRASGLVEVRPGVGAFVASRDPKPARKPVIALADWNLSRTYLDEPGSTHPVLVQFMLGLRDQFADGQARITSLTYTKGKIGSADSAVRRAIEHGEIDGLAIDGAVDAADAQWLNDKAVPFVLLDQPAPKGAEAATVKVNSLFGFRLLLRHLRELNHREILLITYRTDLERVDCDSRRYVSAARAEGFGDFSDENVLLIEDADRRVDQLEYEGVVRRALAVRPDAVLVRDEVIANRVIWEAVQQGIRIPQDLSLASMVDMAPHLHPLKLTSLNVAAMLRECACVAGGLLQRGIRGEMIRNEHVMITPTLQAGESTACINPRHGIGRQELEPETIGGNDRQMRQVGEKLTGP